MPLKITVDTREDISLFNEICRIFPDINFERKKLDAGDYWASANTDHGLVLVERKTIGDMYTSIMGPKQKNGRPRISNETDKLATHENEFVFFLMVGSIIQYHKDMLALDIAVDTSVIYAEMASLMTREKFHFLWAPDEKNGRIMMVKFMQAFHQGKYGVPARRDPVKLMARILRITPAQLTELLNKYHSIQNLSTQKPGAFTGVRGIGPAKEQFILEMLNSKW